MSLKEDILNAEDLTPEKVEVKEWKTTVYLRGLTAAERDKFESGLFAGEGKDRKFNYDNLRARFLVLTLCDEKGERVFSDADAPAFGKKNAKVLDRLFTKAQKLSGMGQADVEELLKN